MWTTDLGTYNVHVCMSYTVAEYILYGPWLIPYKPLCLTFEFLGMGAFSRSLLLPSTPTVFHPDVHYALFAPPNTFSDTPDCYRAFCLLTPARQLGVNAIQIVAGSGRFGLRKRVRGYSLPALGALRRCSSNHGTISRGDSVVNRRRRNNDQPL